MTGFGPAGAPLPPTAGRERLVEGEAGPSEAAPAPTAPVASRAARRLPAALLLSSIALYALTRLWALDAYPITFFGDEAILVNTAQKLVDSGWRDHEGRLLPLYFEAAGNRWIPDLGIYLQAPAAVVFGRSIVTARAAFAVPSVIAAAALGFLLWRFFSAREAWIVVLVLALMPAWFHHSRIAFETALATSFLALFLLAYFAYRWVSPRFLPLAFAAGAASFYSYSNAQAVIGLLGLLLLISDLPYHLRHWRHLLIGLGVGLVLALPFLRFRAEHPDAMTRHLREINSYWFMDTTLGEKLQEYGRRYATGLSPRYWFGDHDLDLARHRVNGRPHLDEALLPLLAIGIGISLWRVRDSRHRALLLAILATPAGAATVDVTVTRVLPFVVPAALLTSLGLSSVLGWLRWLLSRSRRIARLVPVPALSLALFAGLAFATLALARDAFARGPTWNTDYGLYGMQWGAKPLFREMLPELLAEDADRKLAVSPNWANAAHEFAWFFLDAENGRRVRFESPDSWIEQIRPIEPDLVVVATENEYQKLIADPKLVVTTLRTLDYPTGSPGFRAVRLAYREDAEAILARVIEERQRPMEGTVAIDGVDVEVVHSRTDMGRLVDLFDGSDETLMRGLEANPLVFELHFPEPRRLQGLRGAFASMDFTLTVEIWEPGGSAAIVYQSTYGDGAEPGLLEPRVELDFDRGPHLVERMRLGVRNDLARGPAHVHVREITFR